MGKPHPTELRVRVAAFVEEGNSHREAARHFRVSPRFVNNLMKLKAETGSLAARQQGHGPGAGKLGPHADFVRGLVEENGEVTLGTARISIHGAWARPLASDAAVNRPMPARNAPRRFSRSAMRPPSSSRPPESST